MKISRFLKLIPLLVVLAGGICDAADIKIDELIELAEKGEPFVKYNLGLMYYKGIEVPQDYKEAIKWYTKAAEQGHTGAQFDLGVMYYTGKGVAQDHKEAAMWFAKLAEKGHSSAQYNLGVMYYKGEGVPQDHKEAAMWFAKFAEKGHSSAQYNLGVIYYKGEGVPQDYKEAAKWFAKAAEQGHSSAQFDLGAMYYTGEGVAQNHKEAAKWFAEAAEQGHTEALSALRLKQQDNLKRRAERGDIEAQYSLGEMYVIGENVRFDFGMPKVSKDFVQAYKWFNIAAENGSYSGAMSRNLFSKAMTLEQIDEAEKLAEEWLEKHSGADK